MLIRHILTAKAIRWLNEAAKIGIRKPTLPKAIPTALNTKYKNPTIIDIPSEDKPVARFFIFSAKGIPRSIIIKLVKGVVNL